MKFTLALTLALSTLFTVSAKTVHVYFGTGNHPDAKGIYHSTFDTETGKLAEITLAAEVNRSDFLAISPDQSHLYSLATMEEPVVVSYDIGNDGSLEKLNDIPVGDGGGAHLAVHPSGKLLITANYRNGSVSVFAIAEDGSLDRRAQIVKHHEHSGVVESRQGAPHPHWTGFSPDGRFAFVPDLGSDKIHIYKVDLEAATLTPHGYAQSVPGGGPRHMRFSTNGKFIHLLNELTVSVSTYQYDADNGTATLLHTIPALSEETKAKEHYNSASEILVHPNGKFIYTATRGHDSVTAFKTDPETGDLEVIEVEPARAHWPRNTNLDPTAQWLFLSGQYSNTISIFAIDQETGELTLPVKNVVNIPSVFSILFKE